MKMIRRGNETHAVSSQLVRTPIKSNPLTFDNFSLASKAKIKSWLTNENIQWIQAHVHLLLLSMSLRGILIYPNFHSEALNIDRFSQPFVWQSKLFICRFQHSNPPEIGLDSGRPHQRINCTKSSDLSTHSLASGHPTRYRSNLCGSWNSPCARLDTHMIYGTSVGRSTQQRAARYNLRRIIWLFQGHINSALFIYLLLLWLDLCMGIRNFTIS